MPAHSMCRAAPRRTALSSSRSATGRVKRAWRTRAATRHATRTSAPCVRTARRVAPSYSITLSSTAAKRVEPTTASDRPLMLRTATTPFGSGHPRARCPPPPPPTRVSSCSGTSRRRPTLTLAPTLALTLALTLTPNPGPTPNQAYREDRRQLSQGQLRPVAVPVLRLRSAPTPTPTTTPTPTPTPTLPPPLPPTDVLLDPSSPLELRTQLQPLRDHPPLT